MDAVLIVAGLDPSGGAGLLADANVVAASGLHAAGVATALTVQDSRGCDAVAPCEPSLVARQIERVASDLPVRAVKVGMLGDGAMLEAVAAAVAPLAFAGVPVVVDPVLRASVGVALFSGDAARAYAPLLRLAALVTPNRDELAILLGGSAIGASPGERVAAAASLIRATGVRAVLAKGGHVEGAEVVDLLVEAAAGERLRLSSPRAPGGSPHGTGCALSTAIACELALGRPLDEAVRSAHAKLQRRIHGSRRIGQGRPFLGPPS